MAFTFPITIKGVEALEDTRGEFKSFQFPKEDKIFRGLSVFQVVALSYILILQILVWIFLGSEFSNVITCEAWLNIFYTIGVICGLYINLCPTNTGIACYIGLQGLIAFIAFHKFLIAIQLEFDPFHQLGTHDSLDSRYAAILWISLAVNNFAVLITAFLLIIKCIECICQCKSGENLQDV